MVVATCRQENSLHSFDDAATQMKNSRQKLCIKITINPD